MNKIIKVCGMRDPNNIRDLINIKPDMLGLIFYPESPRFVDSPDKLIKEFDIERQFKLVGGFVDEEISLIRSLHKMLNFGYVQLHGNESPEYCGELKSRGLKVIKAMGISDRHDLEKLNPFQGITDLFLFDTKTSNHGGSGKKFDWSVLEHYYGIAPFLLSGGIGPEDNPNINNPAFAGLDLNSRFEVSPGVKDISILSNYFKKVRDDQ